MLHMYILFIRTLYRDMYLTNLTPEVPNHITNALRPIMSFM